MLLLMMMMMMMMIDTVWQGDITWNTLAATAAAPVVSESVLVRRPRPLLSAGTQLAVGPAAGTQSRADSGHLVDELRLLRRRRDELECRMVALQSSRRQLMYQLDTLMTVLKARPTLIIYNNNYYNNTKRKKNEEGEEEERQFLWQRLSIYRLQRWNAILLHESFGVTTT